MCLLFMCLDSLEVARKLCWSWLGWLTTLGGWLLLGQLFLSLFLSWLPKRVLMAKAMVRRTNNIVHMHSKPLLASFLLTSHWSKVSHMVKDPVTSLPASGMALQSDIALGIDIEKGKGLGPSVHLTILPYPQWIYSSYICLNTSRSYL